MPAIRANHLLQIRRTKRLDGFQPATSIFWNTNRNREIRSLRGPTTDPQETPHHPAIITAIVFVAVTTSSIDTDSSV